MPYTIRKLTHETLPPAVDALAFAFFDDPLFRFLAPDENHRKRWLPIVERQNLLATLPDQHTYALVDEHGSTVGAIGATPPGKYPHPTWRTFRTFWAAFWKPRPWIPPPPTVWPILKYLETIDRMHPDTPHWYVDVVGIHPDHQGKGLGRRLLRIILDMADRDTLPVYLDTQTEANVAFYERLGFEVTEIHHPTKTGPPSWGMVCHANSTPAS